MLMNLIFNQKVIFLLELVLFLMIVICVISILYFIRKKKVFSTQYSGADELKKYKELLDLGAIT